ncbi:MAG: hypothetical protein ABGY25_05420, partial [Acidimicrobiales bacterium]
SGCLGIWVSGSLGGLSGPADDNSGLASLEGAPGGKLVRGGHALGSRAETWSPAGVLDLSITMVIIQL